MNDKRSSLYCEVHSDEWGKGPCPCCAAVRIADLEVEVRRLRQELVEALESIIYCCADQEDDGSWNSMACSDVCDAGDKLVAMGLWERLEGGCGRQQWYRKRAASGEGDDA